MNETREDVADSDRPFHVKINDLNSKLDRLQELVQITLDQFGLVLIPDVSTKVAESPAPDTKAEKPDESPICVDLGMVNKRLDTIINKLNSFCDRCGV